MVEEGRRDGGYWISVDMGRVRLEHVIVGTLHEQVRHLVRRYQLEFARAVQNNTTQSPERCIA